MTLSLLAEYDDKNRLTNVLLGGSCEPEFLRFALGVEELRLKLMAAQKECSRLMQEVQAANAARTESERKLHTARQMLDLERKKSRKAEGKVQALENQMALVRDLVWDGRNKLHDETRERLASVYSRASPSVASIGNKGMGESHGQRIRESEGGLSTISEALDSTGSLLSELGYTRSEDELEGSLRHSKGWRKHRPSNPLDAPSGPKKPRSSFTTFQSVQSSEANGLAVQSKECLIATTTVTMPREGPVTAKSTIETISNEEKSTYSKTPLRRPLSTTQPTASPVPSAPPKQISTSESEESMICVKEPAVVHLPSPYHSGINFARDKINSRVHTFCQKTMVKADMCEPCGKRIKFGKLAAKCRECRATVHSECRDKLPLPCVPATCTPTQKGVLGYISDFTPNVPPMIPALILHCVNEIEARGLKEVGIYRVSGSERDVKNLKEKFLRGRGAPNLSSVDIHVICSLVKDFLRSLREPLVMPSMWSDFVRCVEPSEEADQQARLYQVVSELPRPNRDTLAFILLHLQRVSECPECKMPASNLSKIFGPTIVGYSCPNPEPQQMMKETMQQVEVMSLLMKTPSSYWACHVNSAQENQTPEMIGLRSRNPSSSSIQRTGGFFSTPIGTFRSARKGKFFSQL
ncbi:hypothetical protein R5R35_000336 [Gryllus longicercus]|uniref:Rac GTPase-activating protein 1-like n=1 Tax=Gryllus longicercus TaxID=2509291 RepID=A0AAN9ZG48_9ORTH